MQTILVSQYVNDPYIKPGLSKAHIFVLSINLGFVSEPLGIGALYLFQSGLTTFSGESGESFAHVLILASLAYPLSGSIGLLPFISIPKPFPFQEYHCLNSCRGKNFLSAVNNLTLRNCVQKQNPYLLTLKDF